MPTSPASSAQQAREALGRRLGELLDDAGLTARDLARLAGWHESKSSRIINGRTAPSTQDIRAWTLHCGVPGQAEDLIATARGIDEMYVEWRRRNRTGLRQHQESAIPLYERTRHFRIYEPGVIPGLFQTRDYATALMSAIIAFQQLPDDTPAAVEARMRKQDIVSRGDHTFAVLIEESALRARVAEDDVMAAQLGHLLQVAALPNVSLGVIPLAARRTMWPTEGFWLFDDERALVELVSAEVTVTRPQELALYARTFAALAEMAVYGAQARRLLTAAVDALE